MNNTTTQTAIELSSFHYAFQISRKIVFEVNYYRLGSNSTKHFSTSAAQFNQPKTDFNHCGQAQKELLKGAGAAMSFYKKFDPLHIKDLTEDQHTDILAGISKLKDKYNWIESDNDIRLSDLRDLSKMPVK